MVLVIRRDSSASLWDRRWRRDWRLLFFYPRLEKFLLFYLPSGKSQVFSQNLNFTFTFWALPSLDICSAEHGAAGQNGCCLLCSFSHFFFPFDPWSLTFCWAKNMLYTQFGNVTSRTVYTYSWNKCSWLCHSWRCSYKFKATLINFHINNELNGCLYVKVLNVLKKFLNPQNYHQLKYTETSCWT